MPDVKLNMLLLGQIQAGKSSFINTIITALSDTQQVAMGAKVVTGGTSATIHVSLMIRNMEIKCGIFIYLWKKETVS